MKTDQLFTQTKLQLSTEPPQATVPQRGTERGLPRIPSYKPEAEASTRSLTVKKPRRPGTPTCADHHVGACESSPLAPFALLEQDLLVRPCLPVLFPECCLSRAACFAPLTANSAELTRSCFSWHPMAQSEAQTTTGSNWTSSRTLPSSMSHSTWTVKTVLLTVQSHFPRTLV